MIMDSSIGEYSNMGESSEKSSLLKLGNCLANNSSCYLPENQFETNFGRKIEKIGSGTYGEVYKTDKEYAIKKFRNDDDEDIDPSNLTEIAILRYLNHSRVIPLLGFNLHLEPCDSFFRINLNTAMPLIQESLEDIIRKEHVSIATRKLIIYQMLQGLAYCHAHHIWHRDVKPGNILRLSNGDYCLIDFGLSKINASKRHHHTNEVFTLWYRPIEL